MDQLDAVIHYTAHKAPGGLEALAEAMEMSAQMLRNKVNPNNTTHKLSVNEWRNMMRLTGDTRSLEVIAAEFGRPLMPAIEGANGSLMHHLLKVVAGGGDLARAFEEAGRDNVYTPRERAQLLELVRNLNEAAARFQITLASEK